MFRLKTIVFFLVVFVAVGATLTAQNTSERAAVVQYDGIEFTYSPDDFGAVLPAYDEGTAYQPDQPYFANVAPHVSVKFMRPNPSHPDTNWVGELRVYRIAELEAYAEQSYMDTVRQLRDLDAEALQPTLNLGAEGGTPVLPFLPVLNALQVFTVHPTAVDTAMATGVVYYTYYSTAPEPIIEGQVMFVYQGITTDGQHYFSFSMPVKTGLLDTALPADFDPDAFVAGYVPYVDEKYAALNSADTAGFSPSRDVLNNFIDSILVDPNR